jgi:hypothetical protein
MHERPSLTAVDPQAPTRQNLDVYAPRAKEANNGIDPRYLLAFVFLACTVDLVPLRSKHDGIAGDAHRLCPIAVPGRNPVVRPVALTQHAVNAYASVETMELQVPQGLET